jgi:hypothetical protein
VARTLRASQAPCAYTSGREGPLHRPSESRREPRLWASRARARSPLRLPARAVLGVRVRQPEARLRSPTADDASAALPRVARARSSGCRACTVRAPLPPHPASFARGGGGTRAMTADARTRRLVTAAAFVPSLVLSLPRPHAASPFQPWAAPGRRLPQRRRCRARGRGASNVTSSRRSLSSPATVSCASLTAAPPHHLHERARPSAFISAAAAPTTHHAGSEGASPPSHGTLT